MTAADKAFTKAVNDSIKPLTVKLAKHQAKLAALLTKSVTDPVASAAYWNRLRREVDIIYAQMQATFAPFMKVQLPRTMRNTLNGLMTTIEADKSIIATASKSYAQMVTQTAPLSAMMAREASATFLSALNAGRQNVIRFTHVTQQLLLTEQQIDLALIKGLTDGDLRKASRILTGDFYAKMLDNIKDQQFIQAGRYRYKPSYYSEMVARTKFHEAQSIAGLTTAANYGTDLVQISSHNTSTAICIPFEGNVYSINGTHKVFPPLSDTPPYHPNCLHLLYPVFESAIIPGG